MAGTGLDAIVRAAGRGGRFRHLLTNLGTSEPSSPEGQAEAFLRCVGGDPMVLLRVLGTPHRHTPGDARVYQDTDVRGGGADDTTGGWARMLARALPHGRHAVLPGDHTTAVRQPGLGMTIADFLNGRCR